MSRAAAVATVLGDDGRVRVTRFDFAPGAETGRHRHGMDCVITALTDCAMQIEDSGGGLRDVDVPAGTACRRDAGGEHNVIYRGDTPMRSVEIELK